MLPHLVTSAIDWIRKGYPQGIPPKDFAPLMALLQRSLTPEEIQDVMTAVIREHPDGEMTESDVARTIAQVTDAPPNEEDINIIAGRLAAAGWPLALPEGDLADVLAEPREERPSVIQRVLGWLRAGYPEGVPPSDYIPVLAILHRRLTDAEVKDVARALIEHRENFGGGTLTNADVQHMITEVTQVLLDEDDLDRVRARLAAKGWPLESSRQPL